MDPNHICLVNGYGKDGFKYIPAVIVGAGESGIVMGYKLKVEMGFDQFRIFERQAGIGGTWWINRYPGIACDVPAMFYSFSFAPNPRWTAIYPSGPEIYAYLENVCNKYGITDKIQLDTDVTECRWLEGEELWEVTIKHLLPGIGDLSQKDRAKMIQDRGESSVYSHTEKIRTKVVLSCVGGLVEPKAWPEDIPGINDFKGTIFHSARWDHTVDFNDKDVVVVGTGCSAAQLVPRLTTSPFNAKSVTQLMRSPPWVASTLTPPGGNEWWEKNSPYLMTYVPGLLKFTRLSIATLAEYDFRLFGGGKWHEQERKKMERKLLLRMKRMVPEKYHEILTPDYGIGCKRRIFDSVWFRSLNDPKIELTTLPLTSVQEHSLTLGPGRLYPDPKKPSNVPMEQKTIPADIIVLSNGYETQNWLHPLKVTGKQGKDLIDSMMERGGPQAYQGTAMDGFPNFFIIFGPNTVTGHSSVILASENMADYAMRFIKPLLKGDVTAIEVKMDAEQEYTRDIQKSLSKTVWMSGGCRSWYYTKDGWNSTVLPYSQIWFWYRCMFPRWQDWNITYTRKGKVKLVMTRILKFCTLVFVVFGAYKIRRSGVDLKGQGQKLFASIREMVSRGVTNKSWHVF